MSDQFSAGDFELAHQVNKGLDKLGEKSGALKRVEDAQNWLINRLEGNSSNWLEKLVVRLRPGRVFDEALDKAEWYEKGARKDALTGLMTGEAFTEELEKARLEAERGAKFVVMGFDLNGFKEVNDKYGPATGDNAIKIFARALEHVLREGDVVARRQAGGDEFYLLLNIGDGVESLDSFRDTISERIFARVNELMKGQDFDWQVKDNDNHDLKDSEGNYLFAKCGIVKIDEKNIPYPDGEENTQGWLMNRIESDIKIQQTAQKETLEIDR